MCIYKGGHQRGPWIFHRGSWGLRKKKGEFKVYDKEGGSRDHWGYDWKDDDGEDCGVQALLRG
jgi:hypothetical protein